jgi:hypothetical protein
MRAVTLAAHAASCAVFLTMGLHPAHAQHMYWTDASTGKIQRANFDGTGVADVITGQPQPVGIAVDTASDQVFWTVLDSDQVLRARLDGSEIEGVVTAGTVNPNEVDFDHVGGKLYWTSGAFPGKIQSAELDGLCIQDLPIAGLLYPTGVAVSPLERKVYWVDRAAKRIQRADLSGANKENLIILSTGDPREIALDITSDKIYWTDSELGTIKRASLDGSDVETVVAGLSAPVGIAVDPVRGKVIWTDTLEHKIYSADLAGTNMVVLVATGLVTPMSVDLDLPGDCDDDGVSDERDLCPCASAPGGSDRDGRPFGDSDGDCDVDLSDFARFQLNIGPSGE